MTAPSLALGEMPRQGMRHSRGVSPLHQPQIPRPKTPSFSL